MITQTTNRPSYKLMCDQLLNITRVFAKHPSGPLLTYDDNGNFLNKLNIQYWLVLATESRPSFRQQRKGLYWKSI